MSISKYPSKVNLPQENFGWATVFDFLTYKFSGIDKAIWQERIINGKVHWQDGTLIELSTPYKAQATVFYYREVPEETVIPFKHQILYQNEHILVAEKPHFLPVTPGGIYVNECLQHRLRKETGINELQALHRLDRETAGLVIFSKNPETRSHYHALFSDKTISKTYNAIARITDGIQIKGKEWDLENRMVKADPSFLMKIDSKAEKENFNAHSKIKCVKQTKNRALFELKPITGKTHQLRVHMQSIGYPILNDKFYPKLQPKTEDKFEQPLQLLAKELKFIDPITKVLRVFKSNLKLTLK